MYHQRPAARKILGTGVRHIGQPASVCARGGHHVGSRSELGAFESGLAARLLGTVPSVILSGAVILIVMATTAFRAVDGRDEELDWRVRGSRSR